MPRELTQGQSWHLRSQPNSRAKPGPLPAWALILQGRSPRVKSRPWWFTCPSLSNPHRQKLKDEVSKHVSNVNPESAFRCFFFFFFRTWKRQKLGSLQVKNTELALRSVHLLLSWLPFLLLVQQTYWTESALGPIPALKFSSSCEHTLTDAGKKVKLF